MVDHEIGAAGNYPGRDERIKRSDHARRRQRLLLSFLCPRRQECLCFAGGGTRQQESTRPPSHRIAARRLRELAEAVEARPSKYVRDDCGIHNKATTPSARADRKITPGSPCPANKLRIA